ncbi:TIGR03618 family F420-dependent PPOX class oxidoreductase [Streptosporangium sp. CA-115845]|uniref:TIGR03618 family F420-dependent PPOX class oxidoreductase n=1 Tax=Streptosporangium sp. CA-115845 TaxID=3240071 RepID=UPI003D92282F
MVTDRGVSMTEAEAGTFLDAHHTVTLATLGPGGRPHLASMWFARDGWDLLMWTYGSSQKARNVERDPRVGVLAEAGEDYTELRGVSLDCAAEIVRDPAEVLALGQVLRLRNLAVVPGDETGLRAQAAKRIGLRLRVERMRSWDHRKLR